MPVTKVKSNWESGNLVFKNRDGHTVNLISGDVGQPITVKVPLTAGNANAYAVAWQNPEATKIIIDKVYVRITTAGGTASSVLDLGIAATATTASDILIDGLDLNATGIFDNISDGGTNGKSRGVVDEAGGTNDFITGRILTQNAAALVGDLYISYFVL